MTQERQAEAKHATDMLARTQQELERLRTALVTEQAVSQAARIAWEDQCSHAYFLGLGGTALRIRESDSYHVAKPAAVSAFEDCCVSISCMRSYAYQIYFANLLGC